MQYTSALANKQLKRYVDERQKLIDLERQSSVYTAATVENPEDVKPEYDFEDIENKIVSFNTAIRKVKHAINIFNITHVIEGTEMTVDEALVYLPQMNERIKQLDKMRKRLPKIRKKAQYGEKNNFIEYEYINYDIEEVEAKYREAVESVNYIQLELDKLNNTELIEIDL